MGCGQGPFAATGECPPVAAVSSSLGAANDDHVYARVVSLIQIRERAHLGRREDPGLAKASDRARNVAEADRNEIRSELEYDLNLVGGCWLCPRQKPDSVRNPVRAGDFGLGSNPLARRRATDSKHAEAACH